MKKHNNFLKFLLCFSITTIFLSGCKTLPERNIVQPSYLLSSENHIFCSIPANYDDDLIKSFSTEYFPYINEKEIDLFKKYVDKIYIGMQNVQDFSEVQIVLTGNFPVKYINSSLKKNKNFSKFVMEDNSLSKKYTFYSFESFQICLASKNYILISSDIRPLLKNYENQIFYSENFELNKQKYDSQLYEFFCDDINSLKIYMNSSQIIKEKMEEFGVKSKISVQNLILLADFFATEESDENYTTNLKIILNDNKTAKFLKTSLTFLLSLKDSNCEILVNENELVINNLLISKETVYNYLKISS